MKIVLIAPGYKQLPPTGWGAVESVIWDYYENLKKIPNISVSIVNSSNLNVIIQETNSHNADFVHIMYDDHIEAAPYIKTSGKYHNNGPNIIYTSHYAYITHPNFENNYSSYFNTIFRKVIQYKDYIQIFAISESIKRKYVEHGFPECKIRVIHNGAREDLFRYTNQPKFSDKSVYVAKIENRKRQYVYQGFHDVHFVGNYYNSSFNPERINYLGEWNKPTLYENLTNYSNLILLSDGEADPLVVKEALMAGLGLVLSPCCTANLDLTKPFITVIPEDKLEDLDYVHYQIVKNREISIKMREEIRQYALDIFAWNVIVKYYAEVFSFENH